MIKQKQTMWCLVNKNTGKIIKVWSGYVYAIGFVTKKDLMVWAADVEDDEKIRKIEFKY